MAVASQGGNGYIGTFLLSRRTGWMAWTGRTAHTFLNQEIAMDVIRNLLAIILPPLGVFLQVGIGLHFWINILLTLLGYVPGIIHAIWVIVKK